MKKLFACIALTIVCCSFVFAQSLDSIKDGRHYFSVSPNGRYFVGTIEEGPACFFDAFTKEHFMSDIDSASVFAVNNSGVAFGVYNGQPAVWVGGKDWQQLTALDEINGQAVLGGQIRGMSADATKFITYMYYGDGKMIPVFCEVDNFNNWDKKDKWTFSTLPTPTKDDLLYRQSPQYLQVCGMNNDATRILGRYVLYDGKRQLPFIWQKNEEGKWDIKFVAERCLFIEDVIDGAISLPDDREKMTSQEEIDEYDLQRQMCETGIIFDMSPYVDNVWTGQGRYIPISANIATEGSVDGIYYAAVIDVDNDTLVVFDAVKNAGTISVNDKGEVLIYTPQLTLARKSYVAPISNPSDTVRLYQYTKQRTNDKIDLASHTTFQIGEDFDGEPVYEILDGSAVWANEGNAFVTFTYDEWNENKLPHCFMVNFLNPTKVEETNDVLLSVYPNPTNGIVYFEEQLKNVKVFDLTGRKVFEQSLAEQSINLSKLTVGTYIITAYVGNENIITKIVIAR